jgi:hypothetical protein
LGTILLPWKANDVLDDIVNDIHMTCYPTQRIASCPDKPMPSELLIRPGVSDHNVVADLVAPGGAAVLLPAGRSLIARLVIEAHVARQRPELAKVAAASGTPVLVDPLTPLWQGELRPGDKWAQLPYGTPARLTADDFSSEYHRAAVVEAIIRFQIEQGATAVIPPYAYATSPQDPWFERTIQFLGETARFMRRSGVHLPLMPVFCGQLQRFGDPRDVRQGVDRFVSRATDVGPEAIAFCVSPAGSSSDSYSKILRLVVLAERVRNAGVPTIAWRQGVYGPALVAAGLHGYEVGLATRETCDIARSIASRRPPQPGKRKNGGAVPGIYIELLKRTVPGRIGLSLLGDQAMRPKVMCDDERCCPNGVADTIDRRREHAVRTRAKELAALDAQPHREWRLHQIAKDARVAADLSLQANRVLRNAGIPHALNPRGMSELARVADYIRRRDRKLDAA